MRSVSAIPPRAGTGDKLTKTLEHSWMLNPPIQRQLEQKPRRGLLRIEGPRLGRCDEIVRLVKDIEHAYNNIFVFDSLVDSLDSGPSQDFFHEKASKFFWCLSQRLKPISCQRRN
jgi:hypothetical protein